MCTKKYATARVPAAVPSVAQYSNTGKMPLLTRGSTARARGRRPKGAKCLAAVVVGLMASVPGTHSRHEGEKNFCDRVVEDTDYAGHEIVYDNGTDHWLPATIADCCATCHNSDQDDSMPKHCDCWTWGHMPSGVCAKEKFATEELGCCWMKWDHEQGDCASGKVSKPGMFSGHVSKEAHDGGIPSFDAFGPGWIVVMGLVGGSVLYFGGGTLYARATGSPWQHSAFWRQTWGLVVDGVSFSMGAVGRGGGGGGGSVVAKDSAYSRIGDAERPPTRATAGSSGKTGGKKKSKDEDLSALLSEGLSVGGKKGKGKK